MPKNKDLKRLVRSRMQKTGESYTTARRHVVARKPEATAPAATGQEARPAPARDPQRPGMSDAAVAKKTGRTWSEWCELLDHEGAAARTHREIARDLHQRHAVSTWWAQMLTVGYERLRGRRAVHQRAGGFAVTKSRTFPVPLATLARAFAPAARAEWLGSEPVRERKTVAGKVVRWTCRDGTKVDVTLAAKGGSKSQAQLQHDGLTDAADVARRRQHWAARFDDLTAWLARPPASD